MNAEELQEAIAKAAGVPAETVTVKERKGTQIKANALWEGSCRPSEGRKPVGLFLATDGEHLASNGAERRLTLELPFPEAIAVLTEPGESGQEVAVLGYEDSNVAMTLAAALGVSPELIQRPAFVKKEQPAATLLDVTELEATLRETPNVVLQGPPGTGKSTLVLELIARLASNGGLTAEECRFSRMTTEAGGGIDNLLSDPAKCNEPPLVWEFVQLHPSYSYEDLVRRVTPTTDSAGHMQLRVEDGLLPQLCRLAEIRGADRPVLLVLDEINRGNLAAVLGEFVFAIDPGHRGTAVRLQYQGTGVAPAVAVPENLWIVGTMNTADRSLALVDYAIRRRFRFLNVPSKAEVVSEWYGEQVHLAEVALELFSSCNVGLPERLQVGHSAFLEAPQPLDSWPDRISRRVAYQVLPLLAEYAKEGLRDGSSVIFRDVVLSFVDRKKSALALAAAIKQVFNKPA